MIRIKRIYEPYEKGDGYRILVDRLWPRGVAKAKAHLDLWMKDIAPSPALRTWFGHKPERWAEFQKRYKAELKDKKDLLAELRKLVRQHKTVTLLFGAKDVEHNEAIILANIAGK